MNFSKSEYHCYMCFKCLSLSSSLKYVFATRKVSTKNRRKREPKITQPLSHEKCSASFAVFYTSFPESVVDKARSKTALELESRPIILVPYSGVAKGRNNCVFKNNTI